MVKKNTGIATLIAILIFLMPNMVQGQDTINFNAIVATDIAIVKNDSVFLFFKGEVAQAFSLKKNEPKTAEAQAEVTSDPSDSLVYKAKKYTFPKRSATDIVKGVDEATAFYKTLNVKFQVDPKSRKGRIEGEKLIFTFRYTTALNEGAGNIANDVPLIGGLLGKKKSTTLSFTKDEVGLIAAMYSAHGKVNVVFSKKGGTFYPKKFSVGDLTIEASQLK